MTELIEEQEATEIEDTGQAPKSKLYKIILGIGILLALFTAGSGIVATFTKFESNSEVTRHVFGNIPSIFKILFYTIIPLILILGAVMFARRTSNWQRGVPDERRVTLKNLKTRMADFRAGVFMKTLLREPGAGTMHAMMYFSFLVLLAVTTILEIDHQLPESLKFLHGTTYQAYSAVGDIAGAFFVISVIWAILRRFGPKALRPYRIRTKLKTEYGLILGTFLLIGVSGFLTEGFRIANSGTPDFEKWSIVGYPLALLFDGSSNIAGWHQVWWTIHVLSFIMFLIILPITMLRHMLTAPLNMWLKDRDRPKGAMRPMPNLMETDLETFGAATIEDFTWKQLLDTDSCTMCGRCTEACPAHLTGKSLDPREIILKTGEIMAATGTPPVRPPLGTDPEITIGASSLFERITSEEVWSCTTCRACDEACPVNIEILDKILDMRRHLSLMESDFPTELGNAYRSMENQGNPWGMSPNDRTSWAKDMDGVKIVEGGDPLDAEYLYWVGCAGSFDDKNQKVTRAMAELLKKADVSFAILGPSETCTGDPARRSGNEYIFQMLAMQNVETLNSMEVKKIITQCPHCFNTLANEYPQLGGTYEVIHHSELLEKLIDSGDLDTSSAELDDRIVYHDSCYLGRHNDVYMAPRKVISSISGIDLVEAPRNGAKGMCCGAGGARMWMEEQTGKQVNVERSQELLATGATRIATACPFCYVMIDDGVKGEGVDSDQVQVADITLHLLEAIEKGETKVSLVSKSEMTTEDTAIENTPTENVDSSMESETTYTIPPPELVPAPSPPAAPLEATATKEKEAETEGVEEGKVEEEKEEVKTQEKVEEEIETEVEEEGAEEEVAEIEEKTETEEKVEEEKEEVKTEEKVEEKPDNLSLIKGMSPELVTLLTKLNITTFSQIASLSDTEVLELEKTLDTPGRIQRWAWVLQAKQFLKEA